MRVLTTYADGSRTILYEISDRVRYVGPSDWFVKSGDVGTVLGYEPYTRGQKPEDFPHTTRLKFQSDEHKAGGWGYRDVFPWHLELVE